MTSLLPPLLAAALGLLPSPLLSQEDALGDDPPAAEEPVRPPAEPMVVASDAETLAAVRELAKGWPRAVYVIQKGKTENGFYVQQNAMVQVDGEAACELVDHLAFPGVKLEFTFQTMVAPDGILTPIGTAAVADMGQARVDFDGGAARGRQVGGDVVETKVPEAFVTDFTLLRQLPGLERRRTARVLLDHVNAQAILNAIPPEGVVARGEMLCLGEDPLEIEGETFPAWKYRWTLEGTPNTFLWYGELGQLLKKRQARETWTYSPSRTRQTEPQEQR